MKFGDFTAGLLVGSTFTVILFTVAIMLKSPLGFMSTPKATVIIPTFSIPEQKKNVYDMKKEEVMKELKPQNYVKTNDAPMEASTPPKVTVVTSSAKLQNDANSIRRRTEVQPMKQVVVNTNQRKSDIAKVNDEALLRDPRFKKMALAMNGTKDEDSKYKAERKFCKVNYGQRAFLPEKLMRLPPMLYTFPGSGNTWCRLLIEYATGIYTGSVYNDGSLLEALPGEFTCNWRVSVVKVHPHTHPFHELYTKIPSDDNKCIRGNVKKFERAILLIRNPFDSIWSEFQRRISDSHVKGIKREDFNWNRWQANAASLAHAYHRMWSIEHNSIERLLKKDDILYLKYEDLKGKETRNHAIIKILQFLRYPIPNDPKLLEERLKCIFVLADNRLTHRSLSTAMTTPTTTTTSIATNSSSNPNNIVNNIYMTKDIAYLPEIVCPMWKLFGSFASKHGYKVWNDYNCTGYATTIPDVHTGSNGEYDRRHFGAAKPVDWRRPETIQLLRELSIASESSMGFDYSNRVEWLRHIKRPGMKPKTMNKPPPSMKEGPASASNSLQSTKSIEDQLKQRVYELNQQRLTRQQPPINI